MLIILESWEKVLYAKGFKNKDYMHYYIVIGSAEFIYKSMNDLEV